MSTREDLGRALAELAARADDDVRPDRVENIHRRARRAARTRALAAGLAAVVVVGSAVAVLAWTQSTVSPAPPATNVPTTAPAPSSPAPTTAGPRPSTAKPTTTPAGAALVPADATAPAAGACLGTAGPVVTVDANPDVPTPRCVVIRPDQRLRVVNTSDLHGSPGRTITVRFANFPPRVLAVGASTTFDRPAGEYLAVGVHDLRMPPLYPGSVGAVWLQQAP